MMKQSSFLKNLCISLAFGNGHLTLLKILVKLSGINYCPHIISPLFLSLSLSLSLSFSLSLFFFLLVLEFELRALCLLGRLYCLSHPASPSSCYPNKEQQESIIMWQDIYIINLLACGGIVKCITREHLKCILNLLLSFEVYKIGM
jgi:hypothetical protein